MPFEKIASGTGAAVSGAPVFSRRCAGYPGPAALAGPDPSARRSGPRRVGGLRRGRVLLPGGGGLAVLAEQGVDFAFIKATEGSLLQDRRFAANWAGAAAAGVRAGAYHFLSYDSPGETQADNFIAAVPVTEGALPPVVDIEFYGEYLDTPPEKERVRAILDPLLERLEAHYGVKPILYVTYRSYYRYIAGGGYGDYPIWCSSPTVFPLVPGWDFWQYSHSAELEGYYGTQRRIDLNIFRGSRAEFERFG